MHDDVRAIAQLNVDILFSGFGDFPNLGEEVFAKDFDIQLGGGPQIIPLVLDRLDVKTSLGIFYTDDIQSILALKLMDIYGYTKYKNLYTNKKHPTVVTSVLSFPTDRSFIAYNEGASEQDLSDDQIYSFYKNSKICFAPTNVNVLKKLKEDGTITVFDTGWHNDLSIDKYKDILPYIDIFTPNDKEALKMTNTNTVEDALYIIKKYVKNPIIKIGKNGCMSIVDDKVITVPAIDDFVAVDTTGAGDNFLAGVVFGLYHDWTIDKCMEMGNVIGGYSTTQLGCLKSEITYEKAMHFMKKYYSLPHGYVE